MDNEITGERKVTDALLLISAVQRFVFTLTEVHSVLTGALSFIMVFYGKSFFSTWMVQSGFLIDNHCKTIYGPVRSECSSYRVFKKTRMSTNAGADQRAVVRDPHGKISFIFMQFSAKVLPNNRLAPNLLEFASSSGKSWIRQWNVFDRGRNSMWTIRTHIVSGSHVWRIGNVSVGEAHWSHPHWCLHTRLSKLLHVHLQRLSRQTI